MPDEPTEAEVTTEVENPVEPTPETTERVTSDLLNSDAFVDRVADRVASRIERFAGDLIQASQNAVQVAEQMVPIDNAPPQEEPEGEPQPDVAPQRRHRLFSQPMKRNNG